MKADSPLRPDPSPHAKPRLVAEHDGAVAGSETWLGITFDIDSGWHIYWDGRGDTGQPPKPEFTLPPGYKVSEIHWPTPIRYVSEGDIIDYTYEKRTTLLLKLSVPADAKIGDKAALSAKLWWLECEDQCIPRKAEVSYALPIVAANAPKASKDAPRFEQARARLPKPDAETAKVVKSAWSGGTLQLSVSGAKRLAFFPHRTSLPLVDAVHEGAAKGDRLTLRFDPEGKNDDTVDGAVGILEVVRPKAGGADGGDGGSGGGEVSEFYSLHVKRQSTSSSETKSPKR